MKPADALAQMARDTASALDMVQNTICADLQGAGGHDCAPINWQTIHGLQMVLNAAAAELRKSAGLLDGTTTPEARGAVQLDTAAALVRAAGIFTHETAREDFAQGFPDYNAQQIATGKGDSLSNTLQALERLKADRAAVLRGEEIEAELI